MDPPPKLSTPESATPAVVIAATHSGAGKTTATGVVLRALRRTGLIVQPFKIGPDFIDAGYHTEATGRPTINLDPWMTGREGVRSSFHRWAAHADISVIEAMGALYDGEDGTERGSAADIAKLLGLPVVVVLDVWGMTRTTAAILEGLRGFDPDLDLAGCILNRTGSSTHERLILDALPDHLQPMVLGSIRHQSDLEVPERHLGLVTVEENPVATADRESTYERAAHFLDIRRLEQIARTAHPPSPVAPNRSRSRRRQAEARLAVARDDAFCFYYEENLCILQDAGFEIVPFRPTSDSELPPAIDAVYLGGGYPESFAGALASNTELTAQIRARALDGTPIYAECGGLIYLGRSLTGFDGQRHSMADVLPLDIIMDPNHLAISYVEVCTTRPSPLGPAGTTARGQEFHQSRIIHADIEPDLYDITTSAGLHRRAGYLRHNVVASYVHLHFGSNPALVDHLLRLSSSPRPAAFDPQ